MMKLNLFSVGNSSLVGNQICRNAFQKGCYLLFFVLGFVNVFGQTTIFSENIGNVSSNTLISAHNISNGFQTNPNLQMSDGNITNPADVRSSNPSNPTLNNANVYFSSTNGLYGFSVENIDASSYNNLILNYNYRKESASSHASFSIEYFNGTSWITIANTAVNLFNESTSATTGWYMAKQLTLPVGAQISSLKLRFVKSGGNAIRIDDIVLKGTIAGPVSTKSGNWNDASTWLPAAIPANTDNVTIAAGNIVYTNSALTRTGNTQVSGTFELRDLGYASGAGIFTYSSTSGTLNFNLSTGSYGVNDMDKFWPVTNGPVNVNVLNNGMNLISPATRTVGGIFSLANSGSSNVSFPANALILNGICRIDNGGAFGSSPRFTNNSTLVYNSGGTYGRGLEWINNGVGTIGITPGYPNNVQVSNNTILDYRNGGAASKATEGNLTIDGGSSLYMNIGGTPTGGALIVKGNVVNNGTLGLGDSSGDDLKIGGNFTNTGTFDGRQRGIFFTKNGTQTVTSSTTLTFPYVVLQPVSGNTTVQLNNNFTISAPAAGNAISYNSAADVLDINGSTLTIGTTGVVNTISGAGSIKGSTTSNLSLLGNGNIGTLNIINDLNNFTLNRQAGQIGAVLGKPVVVNGTLALTNGILDLNAFQLTSVATGTITGASANNYIIADRTVGGSVRKNITTTGSYTFPIGDATTSADGSQYSPATVNITAGSFASAYLVLNVDDTKEVNNEATTDFISRYWNLNGNGITAATYNFTGTYLPVDINGTEGNSISGRFANSTWTTGSALASNTMALTGLTTASAAISLTADSNHFSAGSPLKKAEINIKQGSTTYLTASTYAFANTIAGNVTDVTFTIENLGLENLTLSGATLSGAGFSLFSNYSSPVAGGSISTFTVRFTGSALGASTGSIIIPNNDTTGSEDPYIINFTANTVASAATDIITVVSEPATISSTVNNATIATITDGVQSWQFTIRDGGSSSDADNLPSILTALNIGQGIGNQINVWSDAIQAVALFDGSTKIADGVVTGTQIQFPTLSISVADNTSKILSLRLSLKCPLAGSTADGDDFVFTIQNANATFSAAGSGKSAFSPAFSVNGKNVIDVAATKLLFITQPTTTAVNDGMSTVVVSATDACGNLDKNFNGSVSLTSTGTLTGSPISVTASGGIATFGGLIHTAAATGRTLTATSGGFSVVSSLFDIVVPTVLEAGDMAILAVNTNNGGNDEIALVFFKDINPGTKIFLTDNGYERKSANKWGGTEGVLIITRKNSVLPKGSILTISSNSGGNVTAVSEYDVRTCGTLDNNWTKGIISGSSFNLNSDDDLWIMQGGVWNNDTGHQSTYTGNVLYGWTESGWDAAPGGAVGDTPAGTKWSTLYPNSKCFTTIAPAGVAKVKFNLNSYISSTTNDQLDWIALINNTANWTSYTTDALYNAGGYDYFSSTTCIPITVAVNAHTNGIWKGKKDTNWFNCSNWDTLKVPDATTDVIIENTAPNNIIISASASDSDLYSDIAQTRNLTISNTKKISILGSGDRLDVSGKLTINSGATLDMTGTGNILNITGDWDRNTSGTHIPGGTVTFNGSVAQIINVNDHSNPEIFGNVFLNNNFDTSASNNFTANGNLNIAATKNVRIAPNDFIQVQNAISNNGTLLIESDGNLIQKNNAGTYTGNDITAIRNINLSSTRQQYNYLSSPLLNNNLKNIYKDNGTPVMVPFVLYHNEANNYFYTSSGAYIIGRGLAIKEPAAAFTPTVMNATFLGKPGNGTFTYPLANSGTLDTGYNLLGNPYPSNMDLNKFYNFGTNSSKISATFYFWDNTVNTIYGQLGNGYSGAAYAIFNAVAGSTGSGLAAGNLTGTVTGSKVPTKVLKTAQGFMVRSISTLNKSVDFDNSTRIGGSGADFFGKNSGVADDRFYLKLSAPTNVTTQTAVVYFPAGNDDFSADDSEMFGNPSDVLYSVLGDKKVLINGKAPFQDTDRISLGTKMFLDGNYTLSLSQKEGIFTTGQNIYLKDRQTGIITNLSEGSYTFAANAGESTGRFEIIYKPETVLATESAVLKEILVYRKSDQMVIKSPNTLLQIQTYDATGRLVNDIKPNSKEASLEIAALASGVYLLKIKTADGALFTRKFIR